jgi:hypothetical protein
MNRVFLVNEIEIITWNSWSAKQQPFKRSQISAYLHTFAAQIVTQKSQCTLWLKPPAAHGCITWNVCLIFSKASRACRTTLSISSLQGSVGYSYVSLCDGTQKQPNAACTRASAMEKAQNSKRKSTLKACALRLQHSALAHWVNSSSLQPDTSYRQEHDLHLLSLSRYVFAAAYARS